MHTDEIVKLSRKRVAAVVAARREAGGEPKVQHEGAEKRRDPRWPFQGAIELWPDGGDGRVVTHGTCLNLSETGVGLSCDEHMVPGQVMEIAVHLSEVTLCGRATVRYCAPVRGQFMVGMEFVF